MGRLLQNKTLLRCKAALMHGFPRGYVALTRAAARTVFYRTERSYLKGGVPAGCELPSVVLLTSIRCASQYLADIISRLFASEGGTTIDLPRYFFHARPNRMKELFAGGGYGKLLRERGFFYGAGSANQPGIDPSVYRIVCVVRDPRDILVSQFYSLVYAHSPSDRKFIRDRKEARERGIDWFVRQPERTGMIRGPLEYYARELGSDESVLFWRYEDVMTEFDRFVEQLLQHIVPGDGGETRALASEIVAAHRVPDEERTDEGDRYSHRRSGRSGQYSSALRADTVDFLCEEYADLLDSFGYPGAGAVDRP